MTKNEYLFILKNFFKDNLKIQNCIDKEDISSLYFEIFKEKENSSSLTIEQLNLVLQEKSPLEKIKKIVEKANKTIELYNLFDEIFEGYKEDYWY